MEEAHEKMAQEAVTECCAYCGVALEEGTLEKGEVGFCSTACEMKHDTQVDEFEEDSAEDMFDDNDERFETDLDWVNRWGEYADYEDDDDAIIEADWEGAR